MRTITPVVLLSGSITNERERSTQIGSACCVWWVEHAITTQPPRPPPPPPRLPLPPHLIIIINVRCDLSLVALCGLFLRNRVRCHNMRVPRDRLYCIRNKRITIVGNKAQHTRCFMSEALIILSAHSIYTYPHTFTHLHTPTHQTMEALIYTTTPGGT